jgi:site-specific DNA-methyltransferase (adenine-specific)
VPFFYTPKASRSEREAGCEALASEVVERTGMAGRGQGGMKCRTCGKWKASGSPCVCPKPDFEKVAFDRPPVANQHPCVKPISIMEWCLTLVAREGAVVLDPFMGSGTTGIAAVRCKVNFIGIEREEEYLRIAEARIRHHGGDPEKA